MSTARTGRDREHRVSKHMASFGWRQIMRAAASKGPADLLMASPEHGAALVQVGSRSKSLGPGDRERFMHAAELCGALAIVAIVIPRQGITYYAATREPSSKWGRWEP